MFVLLLSACGGRAADATGAAIKIEYIFQPFLVVRMAKIVNQEYMCDVDGNVRIPLHLFKQFMSKISDTMKTSHALLTEIRELRDKYIAESVVDGSALFSLEKKAIAVNDTSFDLLMEVDSMVAKRSLPKLSNRNLLVAKPPS